MCRVKHTDTRAGACTPTHIQCYYRFLHVDQGWYSIGAICKRRNMHFKPRQAERLSSTPGSAPCPLPHSDLLLQFSATCQDVVPAQEPVQHQDRRLVPEAVPLSTTAPPGFREKMSSAPPNAIARESPRHGSQKCHCNEGSIPLCSLRQSDEE